MKYWAYIEVPGVQWDTSPTKGSQPHKRLSAPQRDSSPTKVSQPYSGVLGLYFGTSPTEGHCGAVWFQPHKGVPAPQRGASPTLWSHHSPVPAVGEDHFPLFQDYSRSWRRPSCSCSIFGTALVGILSQVPRAQAPPGWRLHLNKFYFLLCIKASPQPAGSGSAPLPDPQSG